MATYTIQTRLSGYGGDGLGWETLNAQTPGMEKTLHGMPVFKSRAEAEKAIRLLRTFGSDWHDAEYRIITKKASVRRDPASSRQYPRVYFEKGAAWKKSTWRPGYYIVVGESTRGGAHLIDEDRVSRPGELVYLLGKSPRGGALWALAKNTRPVRKRRA